MRGQRKSVEERLAIINNEKTQLKAKMAKLQSKIVSLEDQEKEINSKQKEQKLSDLLDIIEASGKTPEEVIQELEKPPVTIIDDIPKEA